MFGSVTKNNIGKPLIGTRGLKFLTRPLPVLIFSVVVGSSKSSSSSLSESTSISSEILALAFLNFREIGGEEFRVFWIFLGDDEQDGDTDRLFFVFRGEGVKDDPEGDPDDSDELSSSFLVL